tara:strand:- start:360 stop:560 length:201 start_codon:yes stop_codon:yes gene_type:complete
MQTVHLKKSDDFAIFIENPGGSWFEITGQGRVALTSGRYVESAEAEKQIQSLCSAGYKRQQQASNS